MANLDFSFNGVNASLIGFTTARIIKETLPEQVQTTLDIPKVPGLVQSSKKYKLRQISITGILEGTSPDNLITIQQGLSAFLYSDEDRQLILSNESDRYYNAQYLEQEKVMREGCFSLLSLEFTCNDPFGYAVTPDSVTKTNTQLIASGYTFNVPNNGQHYAYPIITITFNQPQTHIFMLNNNINDCRFDISKAFGAGNSLMIDSKTERITVNNVYSPAGFGDGGSGLAEFILLRSGIGALGDNSLGIGSTDASIDVSVNVWFRKIYL